MKKFNLSIDVTKLQKNRFRTNEFTTKTGETVKQILADLVVIPTEEKVIVSKDDYIMVKVGFVAEKGKKEDNTNIVGDAFEFRNTNEEAKSAVTEDVKSEDIPF
jgi:hypothetical protein